MHIITRRRLVEFGKKHPDAEEPLDRWYRIVKRTNFESFSGLRKTLPSVDQVGRLTVFNIGGNKCRLIAFIVYKKNRIYIRHILTHKEYNKGKWKE
ncbi:type II toxin-antitoxin system HigB family toxin [candidate division KSB1 bacterium]|nr:type II toxin-antitoxin system HigB family toxin [candidate division KSB1 bacterium]NIR73320.1 type II toxin-antitoxin system HigB family toxin [candidate division KSB1 bacterium]NIS27026.1 type II toxin-antitoxin system HigB family toxin [candidate division KSB1 bacterium]NIT73866.1 type II toxin-antitoxin system HigB family toxin [candidate division KSB1 bacterium]NIU27771.1 type II toxin-antitoxin system HigB family toxin [candidate division KSB1 bacterium]